MSYLRRARLERALPLLEAKDSLVTEVAAKVGLSRLALWRGVRRLRGVAPREVGPAGPAALTRSAESTAHQMRE